MSAKTIAISARTHSRLKLLAAKIPSGKLGEVTEEILSDGLAAREKKGGRKAAK